MNRSLLHSLLICALLVGVCAAFFVTADAANASLASKVYLPIVMKPDTPPTAPSALTATAVSPTAINLSWKDNSNNESGFQIERAPINTNAFALVTTTAANVTTYQNSGLPSSIGYSYRVRAINAAGSSAYTTVASAITPIAPPTAPSGLNASGTTSTATTLKWTDNANNETGFELERYFGGIWVNIAGTNVLGTNATQMTVTGLLPNSAYKFRVRAVNQAGYSAYSNEVPVTTLQSLPAAPTNLAYSNLTATSVKLTWTDNANNEAGFELQEQVNGGAWNTIRINTHLPANTTWCVLGVLTPNTNYAYRLRAVNGAGYSGFSNTVTLRTPALPPTILRVQNSGTVDFIISLKVNNVEYLPTWDKAIAPGTSRDIPMSSGSVNIVATTGWWDTQANPPARFSKYIFTFSGTIDPGTTETITVENPEIEFLLTQPYTLNPVRRAWIGTYWNGTTGGVATFCFYPNGKYLLYDNGYLVNSGPYTMVQYGQILTYFQADDPNTGESYTGKLNMVSGGSSFTMENGPPSWKQITYTWQTDNQTISSGCPANAP